MLGSVGLADLLNGLVLVGAEINTTTPNASRTTSRLMASVMLSSPLSCDRKASTTWAGSTMVSLRISWEG